MQQIAYLVFLFLLNIKQQYVNMISVFWQLIHVKTVFVLQLKEI
jgi:hypothetical protein